MRSRTSSFDLPGIQIDEVAALILAATEVEGDFYFLALFQLVDHFDLLFNALQADILRVFVGLSGDDEFAHVKATAKSFLFEDLFYGS